MLFAENRMARAHVRVSLSTLETRTKCVDLSVRRTRIVFRPRRASEGSVWTLAQAYVVQMLIASSIIILQLVPVVLASLEMLTPCVGRNHLLL